LKPERWGSPLVQEKYQEEKAYDMRHPYRIIIIIIIATFFSICCQTLIFVKLVIADVGQEMSTVSLTYIT